MARYAVPGGSPRYSQPVPHIDPISPIKGSLPLIGDEALHRSQFLFVCSGALCFAFKACAAAFAAAFAIFWVADMRH